MKKILLILLVICSYSCLSIKQVEKERTMVTLVKGVTGDMNTLQEGNFVIKSSEALKKYTKLGKFRAIDFSKNIVVVSVDAMHNTGGYGIKIVSVKEENNVLVVTVKKVNPGMNEIVTMAFTQPFHIIKTQKTDKEIIFKEL